jgi:pimeloyl-ACP methyl ester carboxylesterase
VGWRLALQHPERVTAFIVQNGNAYEEGLKEFWDPIKAYWSDHSEAHRKALYVLVSPETTIFQYTDGVSDLSRVAPDNWVHDQTLIDRPGNTEIQMDIFYDYRTNLPLYPAGPGLLPQAQAADTACVGEERQDLPTRRRESLQARPSGDRISPDRHRSLCRRTGPTRSSRSSAFFRAHALPDRGVPT